MYFDKLLIANRGEIALRIIKTAKQLGIKTYVVYTSTDSTADYVRLADKSILFEGSDIKDTFLNIDTLISIALNNNINAIHPGYGFLSENAIFAKRCEQAGICFIGPSWYNISLFSNVSKSRTLAQDLGIPMVKSVSARYSLIYDLACGMSFPMLIKPSCTYKYSCIAYDKAELNCLIPKVAKNSILFYNCSQLCIEEYIPSTRNVQLQVFRDINNNFIHLFERDNNLKCHQHGIITESPSVIISTELRDKLVSAAKKITDFSSYTNSATLEFFIDNDGNYYYSNLYTSISIDHGISEIITGIDIVEQQLRIASGSSLILKQKDIAILNFAIEARIYTENPIDDFTASEGNISFYKEPVEICNIRIDSSISSASEIIPYNDAPLSKLMVWAEDRNSAIDRLSKALDAYIIEGVFTNIAYLSAVCMCSMFIDNNLDSQFCRSNKNLLESISKHKLKVENTEDFLIAYILYQLSKCKSAKYRFFSFLKLEKHFNFNENVKIENNLYSVKYVDRSSVIINGSLFAHSKYSVSNNILKCRINGDTELFEFFTLDENKTMIVSKAKRLVLEV